MVLISLFIRLPLLAIFIYHGDGLSLDRRLPTAAAQDHCPMPLFLPD